MQEKFSKDDCIAIVENDGNKNAEIENYELVPLDTRMGFLGEYFKLKITFTTANKKEPEEKHFFVKALAMVESQRKFVLDNGAVTKEEAFYAKFVPKCFENGAGIIEECIAKCYLIKTMEVLVFDDLCFEGYRVLDTRSCLTLQHVQLALKVFAKFHASSYILEESRSKERGRVYRIPEDFGDDMHEVLYTDKDISKTFTGAIRTGVETHVNLFKTHLNGIDLALFQRSICEIIDKYPTYVKPSTKYRNVLCHGDLWATNIMFKEENKIPVGCKLVDFQIFRYCPPTLDVVTFLYFCTNREFRKDHFESCINFYYKELARILSEHHLDLDTIFPKRDFMESAEYYKVFAICQNSTYGHLTMINSKLLSNILSDTNTAGEIMYRNRSEVMSKMFEIDDVYREKLFEMIMDLKEIVFGS